MSTGDTIVARSTNPAPAARAVVRISGNLEPIRPIFSEKLPESRGGRRTGVVLGGGVRLPVLVSRFNAPASYTGEDALEISLAGGPAVTNRLIETLLGLPGVRQAEPGEFTARAYLNGRIKIDAAQGVAALIAADSRAQLEAARMVMDSTLGTSARQWSDRLAGLLALVEAGIDFADQEDVVAIGREDLRAGLCEIGCEIGAHKVSSTGREWSLSLPRVVLVGQPSAGKSTLFNALLGRQRSAVQREPGTTRDAIVEPLRLPGGSMVELVDLAGIDGSIKTGLDGRVHERVLAEIDRADAVVLCDPDSVFDATGLPDKPTLRVRTMADRPFSGKESADLALCALDGWHVDDLRTAMVALIGRAGPDAGGAIASRFAAAIEQCRQGIDGACGLLDGAGGAVPWEMVADELRTALDGLGVLAGRVDPDEVLGLIFRTFCVGK